VKFRIKFGILTVLLMLFFSESGFSQTKTVRQAEKKKQEIEQRQKKAYEKARKKSTKDKFNMQTEETQKRMKESRKRSRRNNSANKQPFGRWIFKKKKKSKIK
jgi:hypothetical protein